MARQSFFSRSQIVAIPIPWNIWKGIGERSTDKRYREKINKYSAPCQSEGISFFPVILETPVFADANVDGDPHYN